MSTTLGDIVTALFVPGDRPDRFAKAEATQAGMVIIDLEDAVGSSAKDAARQHVLDWLAQRRSDHSDRGPGKPIAVRVNSTPQLLSKDLSALSGTNDLAAVVLPKYEEPVAAQTVHHAMGVPVLGLVESAVGLDKIRHLAQVDGMCRLALGNIDLALDLGMPRQPSAMALSAPRSAIVLASRLAGLPPPLDGPHLSLTDEAPVRAAASAARELGMGGGLCIHPQQVPILAEVYGVSESEIAWARRVVAQAQQAGASTIDGELTDAPVVARAQALIARAENQAND